MKIESFKRTPDDAPLAENSPKDRPVVDFSKPAVASSLLAGRKA